MRLINGVKLREAFEDGIERCGSPHSIGNTALVKLSGTAGTPRSLNF
jgi:hypothetical protein